MFKMPLSPLNREILRLAIPNILSNLSVPLLSSVDTALMGRLSDVHIGAVGLGSMIFNFIYWNFGFLRMGTTGVTAQFFGGSKETQITLTLYRSAGIALVLAGLMLVLQWPVRELGMILMQTDEILSPYVAEYFDIRIWAAPATLLLYALMGWFFGMQNAIFPLVITVALNLMNVVVSYILVAHYDLGIAGVAWGTVAAQYFGLLIAVVLLAKGFRKYLVVVSRQAVLKIDEFRKFLAINRDIFLRTVALTFAFGFFYSQSSTLSSEVLAVNVILLQYVNWMSYGIDGFAFATESIVGRYFGAGDEPMVNRAIRYNFIWAFAVAMLASSGYWLWGDELLNLFTNQAAVIEAAQPFLWWMILFPLAGFWCYIWDGVYIGLTASRAMRDSMGLALVFFIATYVLTKNSMGNNGLWLSLIMFLGARGIIQWIWYNRLGLNIR